MSVMAVAQAPGTTGNNETEGRILQHLQKLDKAGEDAPHLEQLVRELGISRATVGRYVHGLVRSGEVHVVHRGTMKIVKLGGGK